MAHLLSSKKECLSAEETDLLVHEVKAHNLLQAHWPLMLLDPPVATTEVITTEFHTVISVI